MNGAEKRFADPVVALDIGNVIANQPLHSRVIIVCQPLEQRLSGA